MENKRNQCRVCGGEGKPSKAMLNTLVSFNDFGNDAGQRGTTQSRIGEANLVDCIKCSSCGHSWIIEEAKSTREQALEWWSTLSEVEKYRLDRDTHYLRQGKGISWQNFSGREIEEIWNEVNNSAFQKGDRVIVFDSQTWEISGDIGDNSQFYIPATVINCRKDSSGRWLVDVQFNDGRISNGHFQSGVVKDTSKPNQKQFKQGNDKLFKAYINKKCI